LIRDCRFQTIAILREFQRRMKTAFVLPDAEELLGLLGHVATTFLSATRPEAVARSAFDLLASRLGLEVYFNFLLTPDGTALELCSWGGVDDATAAPLRRLALGEAFCGTVALRGEPIVAESIQESTDVLGNAVRGLGVRAYACHPLLAGSRVIGTLSFGTRTRDRFERYELQLMSAVAEIAAIAIDRATLADRQRQIQRQLECAQENERRRLSRELHDHMGQHLTALVLGLRSLETSGAGAPLAQMRQLRQLAEDAGREAHHLALELRPAALDDLGVVAALENYVEEWAVRFGIAADFDASVVSLPHASPATDITLYRVLQEALNNVAKHARASRVSVVLTAENGWIRLAVEDDGDGFDTRAGCAAPRPALGLEGMRERVALNGGTLLVESSRGRGTSVLARLPLPLAEDDGRLADVREVAS
jgi:signal transduction histidine kinase